MKHKFFIIMTTGLLLCGLTGVGNAVLRTIGTATYGGSEYKLIWDDDNNGNSVVWLDYIGYSYGYPVAMKWADQISWAAGLNAALTYNIDPAYIVDWGGSSWRLPSTVNGPYDFGYDGTTTWGYNITSSEVGHLFYEELENLGEYDTSGTPQAGWGLLKTGDFDHLVASNYWSGTVYTYSSYPDAWVFDMNTGIQGAVSQTDFNYGMAIRNAQVIPLCEGDFNNDTDVDGSDLAVFAADFGRTNCGNAPPCEGDFDSDGDVDGSDLATFAADFGRTDCPTP